MSREQGSSSEGAAAARNAVVTAALALLSLLLAAGAWAWRNRAAHRTRAPEEFASEPSPEHASAAPSDPFSVRVRVVDARDGAPLAGIQVEIASEEPVRRRFGVQASDAVGEARFEGVLAPLALAFAPRSERFAPAITIVQGELGEPREALLRLSAGGELRGRVLDDLGEPVAGAEIRLPDVSPWPDALARAPAVAVSDALGAWSAPRVADLPRLVTRTDERVFAAAWSQVVVEALAPGGTARVATSVRGCAALQAADLVIPRPPTFRGRVLDAEGRAVAGALLSVHPERQRLQQHNVHAADPEALAGGIADLPGMERFRLLPGEALSDADGAFALTGASQRRSVLVALPDGRLQDFPLGAWAPGQTIEGLELALEPRAVLRLRLFDGAGAAVLGVHPGSARPGAGYLAPHARATPIDGVLASAWVASKVDLAATLTDGSELRVQAAPLGDGTFPFALPCELASIERLALSAPGFRTLVREVRGRLRDDAGVGEELLEPLRGLPLTVALAGELEAPPGSEPQELQIRACTLDPRTEWNDPATPRPACCGSGMFLQTTLAAREQALVMPLLSERAYWLHVRTSRGRRGEETLAGPFAAADGPRRLELEALLPGPSAFERPISTQGRRDPHAASPRLRATLCVFDARSGAALPGARLWRTCDPTGLEPLEGRTWVAGADGCAELEGLLAGSASFAVAADGYATQALGPLELAAGDPAHAELDLGEVRLSPVD